MKFAKYQLHLRYSELELPDRTVFGKLYVQEVPLGSSNLKSYCRGLSMQKAYLNRNGQKISRGVVKKLFANKLNDSH